MQKALICELPIRLISQRQSRARGFQVLENGMIFSAMARSRRTCGWVLGARAFWAAACCIICAYCWAEDCSTVSADTSLLNTELSPTSTPSRARARVAVGKVSAKARPFRTGRRDKHKGHEWGVCMVFLKGDLAKGRKAARIIPA